VYIQHLQHIVVIGIDLLDLMDCEVDQLCGWIFPSLVFRERRESEIVAKFTLTRADSGAFVFMYTHQSRPPFNSFRTKNIK